MTKLLPEVRTTSVLSWVVPWHPNKSKMVAAAILNFGKNDNNSGLDKDICNICYVKIRRTKAMRR